MCLVKTPKVVPQQSAGEAKKKLQVLRNRDLDGIDPMVRARQLGSGSFRIDRGTGTNPPLPGTRPAPPSRPPVARTPPGGAPLNPRQSSLLKVLPLILPQSAGAVAKIKRQATQ